MSKLFKQTVICWTEPKSEVLITFTTSNLGISTERQPIRGSHTIRFTRSLKRTNRVDQTTQIKHIMVWLCLRKGSWEQMRCFSLPVRFYRPFRKKRTDLHNTLQSVDSELRLHVFNSNFSLIIKYIVYWQHHLLVRATNLPSGKHQFKTCASLPLHYYLSYLNRRNN